MAYDKGALGLQERALDPARRGVRRRQRHGQRAVGAAGGLDAGRSRARAQTSLGRVLFNEALPEDYRFVNYQVPKKELGAIVNDLAERYPKVQVAATLDALKAAGFHWATRAGHHDRHRRRRHAAGEAGDPGPARGRGREDREAVRARCHHRRRASWRAHRDLDPRAGRGQPGDGGQLPDHQPGLDHGQLGRPRQHDADPPDRRHAWSGRQPEGRDHPAADQGQLPRGSVRAGVLHLHPRCPQGSGRHRAAYRRLRLPHPPAGRRLAGRHHPRGGLRHRARRRSCRSAPCVDGTLVTRDAHVETSVYARALAEDVGRRGRRRSSPRPAPTSATCSSTR